MNSILDERLIGEPIYDSNPAEVTPPLSSPHRFPAPTSPEEPAETESAPETDTRATKSWRGDALQLYLREISQVKLLTREEEIELAHRIWRGDQQAREQMIEANLRLVVKIARDYEGFGLPILDLISEGNIGLMKGVERFEPAKGAKLSTYAAWWIKQAIKRALANQSKTIRLPIHVTHKLALIRRTEIRLRETLDREATEQEVADDMELSPKRVRQYREASRPPVCLDSPLACEDSGAISEIVADENAAAPFDELVRDNDNDLVHEVLATLTGRKKEVLAMRFGLVDGASKTLDEVAEHFGITRERIRQIEKKALEEMRAKIEKRDGLSKTLSCRPIPFASPLPAAA